MALRSWTDALVEPLARALHGREWSRVDRLRDGRYAALHAGPGVHWYALEDDGLVPLSPSEDRKLPGFRERVDTALADGYRIKLLAHRFSSRAVLDLERADDRRIVKLYRKAKHVGLRWGALRPSADGRWRTPKILVLEEERGLLEVERVPGVAPYDRAHAGALRPAHLQSVADVLDWLAEQRPEVELPIHDVQDEVRVLDERCAEFEEVLADPPRRARELVFATQAVLSLDPVGRRGVVHRDYHDKQLLLDEDGRGVLVDLDLVAQGPPALDVGNFAAHLALRRLQGLDVARPEHFAPLRDFVRRHGLEDSAWRFAASTLARLVLIYSRRAHPAQLPQQLLDALEELLEGRGLAEALR